MSISKNAIALIVLALSLVGINVDVDTLLTVISAIGVILSFAQLIIHQVERKDSVAFLFKKKE